MKSYRKLVIKETGLKGLSSYWKIVKKCSDWMLSLGWDHWDGYYVPERLKKKINNEKVYLGYLEKRPIATITLSLKTSGFINQGLRNFNEPQAKAFYISTLAVLPSEQGKGFASQLLDFVEEKGTREGIKYLRLSTRASWKKVVNFYLHRNYKIKGTISDNEDNDEPYFLMEKEIS